MKETRDFWDKIAEDWEIQVGDEGDSNRRLNSDPALWEFAGDVSGLTALDVGCGTGYLSCKLKQRGAKVIGVDLSRKMIEIARSKDPEIDFRVDTCSELSTVRDCSIDLVVSNYVLMDTPDLEGTVKSVHRVLRAGSVAVFLFSHPCFPQGRTTVPENCDGIIYHWRHSYFERMKCVDPPWNHFSENFIWFHRPLSDYWKAFKGAGFEVLDFEEPRIIPERYHLSDGEDAIARSLYRPCSVAFKLRKRNGKVLKG